MNMRVCHYWHILFCFPYRIHVKYSKTSIFLPIFYKIDCIIGIKYLPLYHTNNKYN